MATPFPPDTPGEISVFFENGKYVFRLETQSLYVYDNDKAGTSTCTGECAKLWPPVLAISGSKPVSDWTLIERADRSKQWCYRGRPIYTYAHDQPGQTSGDGIDGVWHLVAP